VTSDVKIRLFEPADEPQAIRYLVEKLPPSEREGADAKRLVRWKWQYYQNPSNPDGKPLIWVAAVDGEFGGMVATIPVRLRTPKGLVLATWGVDFIVDSKMRGLGIGKKLLQAWNEYPSLQFVLGWSPVSFRVATGVGFKVIWGYTRATLALSRMRFAAELLWQRRRKELLSLARVFVKSNPRRSTGKASTEIGRGVPDGVDELWGEVASGYGFCVERDREYLKWRFAAHPTHEYHFVSLYDAGRLAGLGICRLEGDGHPVGIVSDLIVNPKRQDLLARLADETVSFLASKGAYSVSMDLPPALAPEVLRRYRCSLTQPVGMIVRSDDADFEAAGLYTPDPWYISRSDADEDY
jgi:GNAT superfamily N-acetyltransferase